MNPLLRLTREEVEALAGHTPGPWLLPKDAPDPHAFVDFNDPAEVAAHAARLVPVLFEEDEYFGHFGHVGPAMLGGHGVVKENPDARLISAAPDLRADWLAMHTRIAELEAELKKPVIGPWTDENRRLRGRRLAAYASPGTPEIGWWTENPDNSPIARGRETGDAGRRAADLSLVAAGYRLEGGVWGGE